MGLSARGKPCLVYTSGLPITNEVRFFGQLFGLFGILVGVGHAIHICTQNTATPTILGLIAQQMESGYLGYNG